MKAYRLQISIRGAEPAISRIVDIPDHACFHDLHSVIQSVMGWVDCMDYDFTVDDILIGPYEVDEGILNDLETALSDFGGAPIAYRYNLEDPWEIDIEWKGSVDDHPHRFIPTLFGWDGDGPVEEDSEDRTGRVPFDMENVMNSLESWGVQGIYEEGDLILSHDFRMKMLMYCAMMLNDPLVFDNDEVEIMVVTDDPEMQDIMPCVDPSTVASDPERYSIVQNGAIDTMRSLYERLSAKHPELPGFPGSEDLGEVVDLVEGILDKAGLIDEYASSSMYCYIEDLFTWAKDNGVYFYGTAQECGEDWSLEEDSPLTQLIEQLMEEGIDIEDEDAVNEFLKRNGLA